MAGCPCATPLPPFFFFFFLPFRRARNCSPCPSFLLPQGIWTANRRSGDGLDERWPPSFFSFPLRQGRASGVPAFFFYQRTVALMAASMPFFFFFPPSRAPSMPSPLFPHRFGECDEAAARADVGHRSPPPLPPSRRWAGRCEEEIFFPPPLDSAGQRPSAVSLFLSPFFHLSAGRVSALQ